MQGRSGRSSKDLTLCSLPDQMLLGVFLQLGRGQGGPTRHPHHPSAPSLDLFVLPGVCKRFNDLLREPTALWESLDLEQQPVAKGAGLTSGFMELRSADSFCDWLNAGRRAAVHQLRLAPANFPASTLVMASLADNLTVICLHLNSEEITGDEATSLQDLIGCCRNLVEVEVLVCKELDEYDSLGWLKPLNQLRKLTLGLENGIGNRGALNMALSFPHLTYLSFIPLRCDWGFLSRLSGLQSLQITGKRTIPVKLSYLEGLSHLTHLELEHMGEEHTLSLATLSRVHSLRISYCPGITLEDAGRLTCLQRLEVTGMGIYSIESLPQLTSLTWTAVLGLSISAPLAALTTLVHLECKDTLWHVLPRNLTDLRCLTGLQISRVRDDSVFTVHTSCLRQLTALRSFQLNAGSRGASILGSPLHDISHLTKFDVVCHLGI